MPESLPNYLVQKYMADLRRDLAIQGIEARQVTEILAETESHLAEAIDAAQPQSGPDAERVVAQFGSATVLANRLAQEYERKSIPRHYLWPAALFLIAYQAFRMDMWHYTFFRAPKGTLGPNGLNILGHQFFPAGLWIGSVFLVACGVALFVLGFRARRPVLGQFLAACAVLTFGGTAWSMATSDPLIVSSGPNIQWIEPVPRSQFSTQLAQMHRSIDMEHDISRAINEGKAVFSRSASSEAVPAGFKYGNKYMMPEAVREVRFGSKPSEVFPDLLTSSWTEAVNRWNNGQRNRGGVSEAAEALDAVSQSIAMQEVAVANLTWIHNQPLSAQIPVDFRIAAFYSIPVSLMAMIATLAGWVFWWLVRLVGTLKRKARYRSEGITAS